MTSAGLSVDMRTSRGDLAIRATFTIARGETLALLGPNGAGKSTVLHAIAGLVPVEAANGRPAVTLDGQTLDARQPHDRPVGLVFQDLRLFPHLDALANVAFGLRARGHSRADAEPVARQWLERVGASDLADRRPDSLSGGESQRVALARALATRPDVLLLDEPLSALDASARPTVRATLRAQVESFDGACLIVTHDAQDARALTDTVAVMERGRTIAVDRIDALADDPPSRYVADTLGRPPDDTDAPVV